MRQICQNPKLKFLDYLPCLCKIPIQKHFWTLNSLNMCEQIFNIFAAHFRTKGILNNDKIIFVWGCLISLWYAKNLLLKDVAYGVGSSTQRSDDERFRALKVSGLNHSATGAALLLKTHFEPLSWDGGTARYFSVVQQNNTKREIYIRCFASISCKKTDIDWLWSYGAYCA